MRHDYGKFIGIFKFNLFRTYITINVLISRKEWYYILLLHRCAQKLHGIVARWRNLWTRSDGYVVRHISPGCPCPGCFAAGFFWSLRRDQQGTNWWKTRVWNALMDSPCLQKYTNSFELLESRVSDKTVHAVAPTRPSMGLSLTKRRLLVT